MLQVYKDVELAIPEGIEVTLHSRKATIKGPRGELTKVSIAWEMMLDMERAYTRHLNHLLRSNADFLAPPPPTLAARPPHEHGRAPDQVAQG